MNRWLWSVIVIVIALVAALTTFWFENPIMQLLSIVTFLLFCPGMAIVSFLRLHDLVQIFTIACALSLALDSIVASAFLYGGIWSPHMVLELLLGASAYLACVQLAILLRTAWHARPTGSD
jgi:hypothetical protein